MNLQELTLNDGRVRAYLVIHYRIVKLRDGSRALFPNILGMVVLDKKQRPFKRWKRNLSLSYEWVRFNAQG